MDVGYVTSSLLGSALRGLPWIAPLGIPRSSMDWEHFYWLWALNQSYSGFYFHLGWRNQF